MKSRLTLKSVLPRLLAPVLATCLFTSAQAAEFVHLRTKLGTKVATFEMPRSDLKFQVLNYQIPDAIDQNVGLMDAPVELIAGPTGPVSQQISSALAAVPSFEQFRLYTREVTGSDAFVKGAPLYAMVRSTLRTVAGQANVNRVFGVDKKELIKVEIYDGLQDWFFYSESYKDGKVVFDSKDCTYYRKTPLWTLRFTNSRGESLEMNYSIDLVISENKFLPAVSVSNIVGIQACLNELVQARGSANRLN